MTALTRRHFLSALGVGAAAIVVPELVLEPRRRFWQVSRNAPVSPRSPFMLHSVATSDITFDLPSGERAFFDLPRDGGEFIDRMSIDHEAKRLTFTREPGRIPVRRMSRDALAELYPDPREYKIDRSVPGKWELYQSSGEAYSFDAKLQTLALLRDAGHITDADAIRVITSPLCPRGTAYLVKNTIALTGSEKREGGVIE